jgi:predicted  nucleic acid-binding Zn-ribbon protein
MHEELVALVRLHEIEFGSSDDAGLSRERAELEIERCRLELSPALLARYEQLKKRYASGALIEVQDGICSGCRVVLPRTSANRLKSSTVSCDHCGRILYDPDSVYHFQY